MPAFRTLIAPAILLAACNTGEDVSANGTVPIAATDGTTNVSGEQARAADGRPFTVQEVADFDSPWALAFLPDGRLLVTEKAGQMLLVSADGRQRRTVATIGVDTAGQGGLMDVRPAPDFARTGRVYFSYSTAGDGGKGVVLARGVLDRQSGAERLRQIEVLFRATPFVSGDGHYSGRIAFAPDGRHLFFTNGERQKFDPAQDPKATLGKVLRLTMDGQPAGDPGLRAKGFHPAVWSYGHRNLLGLAFDASGNLWEQEMGPKGGDEVNLILPGRNYGYPIVSDGDHYDGRPIPNHNTRPEFERYKVNWTPVISPGGLMVYSGRMFPDWRGDLFIGGLSSKALVRVDVNGTNAAKGDQWDMGTRIRDVAEGPDGAIWLIEDGQRGAGGKLMRLSRPTQG